MILLRGRGYIYCVKPDSVIISVNSLLVTLCYFILCSKHIAIIVLSIINNVSIYYKNRYRVKIAISLSPFLVG